MSKTDDLITREMHLQNELVEAVNLIKTRIEECLSFYVGEPVTLNAINNIKNAIESTINQYYVEGLISLRQRDIIGFDVKPNPNNPTAMILDFKAEE